MRMPGFGTTGEAVINKRDSALRDRRRPAPVHRGHALRDHSWTHEHSQTLRSDVFPIDRDRPPPAFGQTCPVLLAVAGRRASDAASVRGDGEKDCGASGFGRGGLRPPAGAESAPLLNQRDLLSSSPSP